MPQRSDRFAIFVYGSLQFQDVIEAVSGRRFPAEDAVLHGYRRRRIQNHSFPGIRPDSAEKTQGQILRDVLEADLQVLDAFEGDLYERKTVSVRIGSDRLQTDTEAFAYVIRDEFADWMSAESWDLGWFQKNELRSFIPRCREFRDEILDLVESD